MSLKIGYKASAEQFGPREYVEDATEKEEHMPNSDKEVITHLAFYAGWPKAMSAITVARQVFEG